MVDKSASTQRIVLAKIGLDGHDRGIKIVARGLRDAGFHVIYAGLWQAPEAVVQAVQDEDADWLGISLLSGAHLTQIPRLLELLAEGGLSDVGVIVGGIIPESDIPQLKELGVKAVFGPGTRIDDIVGLLQQSARRQATDLTEWTKKFRVRDRRALSRLLTLASNGEPLDGIGDAEKPSTGITRAVALTGSGGVGKSSLIARLVDNLRGKQKTVAVLACDPQSSVTGGALLGDRVRMSPGTADSGLFIRSLAAPAGQQAIAAHLESMIGLLREFGIDVVLLETVGAGQGDTAVSELADVFVVLVQPESGDELQWEKAGVLELADIVVVHKSDLPGADRVQAQIDEQLNLRDDRPVPVLKASSAKGEGLDELWQAIERRPSRLIQPNQVKPP